MIVSMPPLTLLFSMLLPFVAALLCFALNRIVATRLLALLASSALALAGILLMVVQPLPATFVDTLWLSQNIEPVHLVLQLDQARRLIVLLVLGGGALAMLTLGYAIPAELRRFGTIPGALLFLIMAVVLGLLNRAALLQPLLWMSATLATAAALRVSGPDTATDAPLITLLSGAVAAVLLLGCELLLSFNPQPSTAVLVLGLLAAMLSMGLPPLHAATHTNADAPSVVASMLTALGLPVLGAFFLIRLLSIGLTPAWTIAISLLGLLAMATCAMAAFASQNAGKLLIWQHGAQQGMIMLVAAQGGLALSMIAPSLILVASLSTLAGGLALAAIERTTGTAHMTELRLSGAQIPPALTLLVSSAAAAGMPGTWGFWGRVWFLNELPATMSWLVGPFLAASMLLLASTLSPVASILRRQPLPRAVQSLSQSAALPAFAVALPLIAFGIAPHLAIRELLNTPLAQQVAPNLLVMLAMLLAIIALIGGAFLIAYSHSRTGQPIPIDQDSGPLPTALAESLRVFTWLARPSAALNLIWAILLMLSQTLVGWLRRIEDRYYIASLMVALIIVILVFI